MVFSPFKLYLRFTMILVILIPKFFEKDIGIGHM